MRMSSQAILAITLMVALSVAAALLPRPARAETPMGATSLAEAKREAMQQQRSQTQRSEPMAAAHRVFRHL